MYSGFGRTATFMEGNGMLNGKKRRPARRGAQVALTETDPSRAQIEESDVELEAGMSAAEQKRKRRQRMTKGNNPFQRAASVLGA